MIGCFCGQGGRRVAVHRMWQKIGLGRLLIRPGQNSPIYFRLDQRGPNKFCIRPVPQTFRLVWPNSPVIFLKKFILGRPDKLFGPCPRQCLLGPLVLSCRAGPSREDSAHFRRCAFWSTDFRHSFHGCFLFFYWISRMLPKHLICRNLYYWEYSRTRKKDY